MTRFLTFILTLLIPVLTYAHQAEISTTMLIEKEGKWLVQINGALSAFEYELKVQHGDSAYKSPEEFQELVAQMIVNKLKVSFDGKLVQLNVTQVKIGHETSVVMDMNNVPNDFTNLRVKNDLFDEINKSRSALVVLKEGAEIERFELNTSNDHTIELKLIDNVFEQVSASDSFISKAIYGLIILVVVVMLSILFSRKSDKSQVVSLGQSI